MEAKKQGRALQDRHWALVGCDRPCDCTEIPSRGLCVCGDSPRGRQYFSLHFFFFFLIPVGSRFSFAFNLKITLGDPHTRRKKNLDVIWRRFQRGLVNERAEDGNSFAAEGKESL